MNTWFLDTELSTCYISCYYIITHMQYGTCEEVIFVSANNRIISFCLQIPYRKVRNLQTGVDKLVGKVSINLLCYAKSAACIISIISIIINAPAVAYAHI